MATIDLTTPVAQGGCGCSNPADPANVAAAISVWRTFANTTANQPATLTIAAGPVYDMTACENMLVAFLKNVTAKGVGGVAQIQGMQSVGSFQAGGEYGNSNYSAQAGYIDSVEAGQSVVHLLDAADVAKFAVGDFILIGGLETMYDTFPPNLQFFEYNRISYIGSPQTIGLEKPTKRRYLKTWPLVVPSDPFAAGPAAITAMDKNSYYGPGHWDCTTTLENLEFLRKEAHYCWGGRYFNFINVRWPDHTHSFGQAERIVLSGCRQGQGGTIEFDKLVEYFEINNSELNGTLYVQSNCANNVKIVNSYIGQIGGTCGDMVLDGVTGWKLSHGPAFFGVARSLSAKNCNFEQVGISSAGMGQSHPLANYEYIGDGTFRNAMRDDVYQHAVPGREYIVAWYGGALYDVDQNGQQTRFCVYDIWMDEQYCYIKTSLTGLPDPNNYFVGNPANKANLWYPAPYIKGGYTDGGGSTGAAIDKPQYVGIVASSDCGAGGGTTLQVTVTINPQKQNFDAGTVAGDWSIEALQNNSPVASYRGPQLSHVFDLAPGDYVMEGVRLAGDGSELGPVATANFTVTPALVLIDVAGSLTVTA